MPKNWNTKSRGMGMGTGPVYTDVMLGVDPMMIDHDNGEPFVKSFSDMASTTEGVSGREMIDTMYENTSMDVVENPREGTTPAPVDMNGMLFPHRRL